MWRRNLVVGGILVCFLLAIPAAVIAPHTAPEGGTQIGSEGLYRDVEIDGSRGRAYVTNGATWTSDTPTGVLVVDLDTHRVVDRIPIEDPTGVDLSPSGNTLAVGALDGYLRLIDPNTLRVTGSAWFAGESYTPAYLWDVSFVGEDRLVVSLGSSSITCQGSVLVVSLPTFAELARLSEPPCGIQPWSQVQVNPAQDRLYVLAPSQVTVYNLTSSVPSKNASRTDSGFSGRGSLTPDGQRLVFSSGMVYDASTLGFLADVGRTGEVSIEPAGTNAYFAHSLFVDEVRLNDYVSTALYVFEGSDYGNSPLTVSAAAIDGDRRVAYLVTPRATNANLFHAVPLFPGFVDPYPWNGWILPRADLGAGAHLSGGIDPASVLMKVDGVSVSPAYDPQRFWIWYRPASPWSEGSHQIELNGTDASGGKHDLAWSFMVDTLPPQIVLDDLLPLYRTTDVTLHGTIIEPNFLSATANSLPLAVNATTGVFDVTMHLEIGANQLFIDARDRAYNENGTVRWILYVPPTNRHVNAEKGFSIEYPASWSLQVDTIVQGTHVDAIMSEPSGTNANVIAVNDPANATEEAIRRIADQVYGSFSSLPGFSPHEPPAPYDVPGLFAYSYSYERGLGSGRVYQRQVLVADTVGRHTWALTFTTPFLGATRYDPFFRWMASSFRLEQAPASVGNFPPLAYVVGLALFSVAALGLAMYFATRVRERKSESPMGAAPLPPDGLTPPPPSPQEPPSSPPPGS